MICYRGVVAGALLAWAPFAIDATAQPLGTFRWQLQPFCKSWSVAITQNGAVYRLEGTDDQCGNGADAASVTGTAFPNADGTIGFGLNIVTAPGGRPVHVDAEISLGTFSGTWRDSAGATGAFAFTPGAGNGGSRTTAALIAGAVDDRPEADGAFVAGGVQGVGSIPASGPGTRMMWYPGKAAFRVGRATTDEWDDANVGVGSVALGVSTRASGDSSTALGGLTRASGFASTALGSATRASGLVSTAMGAGTTASSFASTAIGDSTTASGASSIAMGASTTASGIQSTAMGLTRRPAASCSTALGNGNTASGENALAGGNASAAAGASALAFGAAVRANGNGSVALGTNAFAAQNGSFVFADRSVFAEFAAPGPNQFHVRAGGGVKFASNAAATLGVELAPNGSQFTSLSDVRTKHRFRELDGDDVLAKIAQMPVTEWSYKAQDAAIRHIGPTAQDFHAAFGLGEDPLRIGTLDADGVALAGVRALEARSHQHADEIAALKAEIARLRELLVALAAMPR